jgi:hypothetical protein
MMPRPVVDCRRHPSKDAARFAQRPALAVEQIHQQRPFAPLLKRTVYAGNRSCPLRMTTFRTERWPVGRASTHRAGHRTDGDFGADVETADGCHTQFVIWPMLIRSLPPSCVGCRIEFPRPRGGSHRISKPTRPKALGEEFGACQAPK